MRYCNATPTCRELVPKGRCPTHTKTAQVQETRYTKGNYGRPWRRRREQYLEQTYPWWCAIQGPACTARGRMMERQEVEVDHIIPHRGDPALRDDPTNYQVTCKACHSAKTATEVGWR
jgi:5-methylcytosine-specific restriction protein A